MKQTQNQSGKSIKINVGSLNRSLKLIKIILINSNDTDKEKTKITKIRNERKVTTTLGSH